MQRTTLLTLDDAELAAAFNRVYADYVVPFAMDGAAARRHVQINDVALPDSPLWLDEAGEVVALAALGVRERRGWVGGFGIAPAHRGRGLGGELMRAVLECARRRGLERVQLEVLANNPVAIRVYERAGFVRDRVLLGFASGGDDAPVGEVSVDQAQPAESAALLLHHARLRAATPAWQREPASLTRLPDLQGLAIGGQDQPNAYLLYRANDRRNSTQIWDLAAREPDAISRLIGALAKHSVGRPLTLFNEPAQSPICAVVERLGWLEQYCQYEMSLALS